MMQQPSSPQTSSSRGVRQGASIVNEELTGLSASSVHVTRRSSSNGGQRKTTASTRPTVSVHVAALGSGRWTDETGSYSASIDCAVELDAQRPVKETAQPARPKGLRRCIKCITAVIVLGVVTAAVLVPIALITGVNHRRPAATQRTVPQPATAHKILFAFKNLTIYPKAASIFSTAIAEEVTQWVVLPSSRVHVAAFSNHLAMQQALAALSNTASLKYAMADFHLVADRGANRLINPDQLLELSKELPARHLLQQTGSAKTAASQHATKINTAGRHVNVPQASRLVATHKQRLAERKARRQLLSQQRSLAAAHLPSTARTHQHSLDGAAPGMQQPETFGCTSTGCTPLLGMSDEAAALSPCTAGQHLNSRAYGTLCADSRWINSSIVGVTASRRQQRQLKQYQEPPPPPEPQPQQRQALIQPQRGGTGVAWYLADPALQTKAAWNITYGFDEVLVAVIDSGIELSHGGVGAAVWANAGEVAGDGLDNDNNGFVDDVMGWDFGGSCNDAACSPCTPGPDPSDVAGWGTHAAAVIAAQPEVTSGTSGIAPGVRVMALKISDCRTGTQLGDYSSQQLAAGYQSVNDVGRDSKEWAALSAGPALLGSAAVQAFDYAVLNGAHIVLAAWQAGDIIDDSLGATAEGSTPSNSTAQSLCVLGADAAAAAGVAGGADVNANGTAAACIAAVQELIFRDAIKPLEQAGLLVVTMQPDTADSSSTAATVPCKLGQDISNVLCVSSSQATESSANALNEQAPASEFFDALIYTMNRNLTAEAEERNTVQPPDMVSNNGTVSFRQDAQRDSDSSNKQLVQLMAPGNNILAGWAWASHAEVSGGSAAAAVAAGAAALTWSALGQALGAQASARAHEGLGRHVRQLLSSASSGQASAVSSGGGTAALLMDSKTQVELEGLNLLQAIQAANAFTGPLELTAAQISPTITTITSTLSYSWYITTALSGPYDTDQMAFVARKAVMAPHFPLSNWEFYGPTSLVKVEGFVMVDSPGNYSIAAASDDKFIVWLDDKWLQMQQIGDAGAAVGLPAAAWVAGVHFRDAGYYKLHVNIYNPGLSSFDLKWQTPDTPTYAAIPHFVSFGRTQPLPHQLLEQVTSHMLVQGGATTSSSRGGSSSSTVLSSEYSNSPGGNAAAGVTEAPSSDTAAQGATAAGNSMTVDTPDAAPATGSSISSNAEPHTVDVAGTAAAGAPVTDAVASIPQLQQPYQPSNQQPTYAQPGTYPNTFNFGGLDGFFSSIFGWERGSSGAAAGADSSSSTAMAQGGATAGPSGQPPVAAAAAVEVDPPFRPSRALHGAQWMSPTRTISPLPGIFSVAAALVAPTGYRTILPALPELRFSHVGILPGPGLQITTNWQLQQQLLGFTNASDDQAGYGVVQGWLDWQTLNPEAYNWLQEALNPTDGLHPAVGGVTCGTAGVQFELACASGDTQMSCSLHVDGQVVAGSLDETQVSSCIAPSRRQLSNSGKYSNTTGSAAAGREQLMHIELLFAADDMRAAQFTVKTRPCILSSNGSVHVPSGSAGAFVDLVAEPTASALGLTASAVQSGVGSSYQAGMLCSVKATVPPSAGNLSSTVLERTVYLTAEELQQTLHIERSSWEAPGVNSSVSNDTHAEPTAKAVAGIPGIAVQQLVPDWVTSLPLNTMYGFHCGCYWNGSWGGNVSTGIHAGGTGSAFLYLAGWPVAASRLLPVYGPSDIDVTLYSSWQQQQQLLSGSSSADPLRWQDNGRDFQLPDSIPAGSTAEWIAAMFELGFRPTQLLGGIVFTLGDFDSVQPYAVPAQSGWFQLLVIQGDMMDAQGRVVVAAAVQVVSAADESNGVNAQGSGPAAAGWLPGTWDAWVPA